MKKLNVFLLIVLLLLLALVAVFFIGSRLSAEIHIVTAPAAEHPDAFASIQNVLASGSAPQQFTGSIPASPEGCTLMDVTITLTNPGFIPAEWIDVSVTGLPGDIAVYSLTGAGSDIPARSSGQINLKLITTESPSASRPLRLTYHVLGRSLSLRRLSLHSTAAALG